MVAAAPVYPPRPMIHRLFLVLSMSEGAMSGPRVISAPDTFFAKVVVSAGLLIGIAWLVWAIRWEVVHPGPHGVSAQTIASFLLGIGWATWLLFRWSIPLKRVIVSETSLHVSNFLHEVVVPLRDVDSVHQREGTETVVIVQFARKTAFGRRIMFSGIGWKPPQPHPIVGELRAVIAAAKAK